MASLLSYKHISRQFRLGVRFLSSVSESNNNNAAQKFAVKIKSSPATNITENEIDEMFDYSADTDDDIADSWDDAMNLVKTSEILFPPHKPSEEELGNIRAAQPTSTLVSLVNTSDTLQRLVDLGVQLHVWDTRGKIDLAAKLEFSRDVVPMIRFLTDIGVSIDNVGRVLTFCPQLMEEREEDLMSRVAYLVSKGFSRSDIDKIVTGSPSWLLFSVRGIDARLGFFQKTFNLTGSEVRSIAVTKPTLIVWSGTPTKVKRNLFSYNEEMGFTQEELRKMVVACPDILKISDVSQIQHQFELLHNVAKIPHEILSQFPASLRASAMVTRPRIQFLQALGRDQFDPDQPNYISPDMLTVISDQEFCNKSAKCSEQLFNKFQKTL